MNDDDLDLMVSSYVECAFWASTTTDPDYPDDPDRNPIPFDELARTPELSDEAFATMYADCKRFASLPEVAAVLASLDWDRGAWSLPEQVGHDLWLTRNGHGAGFWDRTDREGLSQAYRDLANLVGWRTDFPEQYLYIGDDGKVYIT